MRAVVVDVAWERRASSPAGRARGGPGVAAVAIRCERARLAGWHGVLPSGVRA